MVNDLEKKTILVAMSGGVDSSVAALLLKQQGHNVVGATMKLWDYGEVGGDLGHEGGCCDLRAINNARAVCESLGMRHYVLDFTDVFKEIVIENFVSEYLTGRTPNPCVLCNTEIKWELFLKRAVEIGCSSIATGHYARLNHNSSSNRLVLRRGIDNTRDQSYALWGVGQEALARTYLPLGDIPKTETRRLAEEAGLKTARVAESMEICFVADDNYERFIREWTQKAIDPGDIINRDGQVIGRHKGIPFYTVGQRRGLGIAHPTPLYVQEIDVANNRLIVGEDPDLASADMIVSQVNWVSMSPTDKPFQALVQIRYQHSAAPAKITPLGENRLAVNFDTPQRAVTPGQSAVFYDGDIVLAGGLID
ncbi:MAG: tRNA 2-thiouridine(34) synthase MnmA [FCB group bacterium]|nr:tRNA 2-thiouridine(34) synthase MnmA [FCB group bacterium]